MNPILPFSFAFSKLPSHIVVQGSRKQAGWATLQYRAVVSPRCHHDQEMEGGEDKQTDVTSLILQVMLPKHMLMWSSVGTYQAAATASPGNDTGNKASPSLFVVHPWPCPFLSY